MIFSTKNVKLIFTSCIDFEPGPSSNTPRRTGELCETDCAQDILDQEWFWFEGKRVKWRDFVKIFPRWKKPQLALCGVNGEFRKMFFSCFQRELAAFYAPHARVCTRLPDYDCDKELLKARLQKVAAGEESDNLEHFHE